MLRKLLLKYLYAGLLLLIGSNDLLPVTLKASKASVAYTGTLDECTVSFLRVHKVDSAIADTLTTLFNNSEIQKHISCMYTGDKGNVALNNYYLEATQEVIKSLAKQEADTTDEHAKYDIRYKIDALKEQEKFYKDILADIELTLKASKMALTQYGFNFLGGKYHIFTLQQLPGYVFKMALPWDERTEELNVSRIKFSQLIRAVIQKKKLKIRVPKKWAYFVPENKEYVMPKILIVAQLMDTSNQQPLSQELNEHIDILMQETGFSDDHTGNIIGLGDYAAIVDTEERTDSLLLQPSVGWYQKIQEFAWHKMNNVFANVYQQVAGLI